MGWAKTKPPWCDTVTQPKVIFGLGLFGFELVWDWMLKLAWALGWNWVPSSSDQIRPEYNVYIYAYNNIHYTIYEVHTFPEFYSLFRKKIKPKVLTLGPTRANRRSPKCTWVGNVQIKLVCREFFGFVQFRFGFGFATLCKIQVELNYVEPIHDWPISFCTLKWTCTI